MSCNCGSCSSCSPQVIVGPSGRDGTPGLPPEFVAVQAIALPAGSSPTAQVSGVSPNLTLTLGIPSGAVPAFSVGTVVEGALGVTITGSTTAPVLNFSFPAPTDGEDGLPAFTTLTDGFTMPAVDATVTINVGSSEWMGIGAWIWVESAGVFRVASQPAAPFTSVTLLNPGASVSSDFTDGVPGNASPGNAINSLGTPAQVAPSGRPGSTGAPGIGLETETGSGSVFPTLAPESGSGIFFWANDADAPTEARVVTWDPDIPAWVAGVSILGPAGTLITFQNSDPTAAPPAGNIGTVIIRTDVPGIYRKNTPTTSVLETSLTNTFQQVADASSGNTGTTQINLQRALNLVADTDTHAVAGTYTFDLQYPETQLSASDDVEIDWTGTNSSEWVFKITNTSGASIALTYAASQWARDPAVTLPTTIAAGVMVVVRARKATIGASTYLVIEQAYAVSTTLV